MHIILSARHLQEVRLAFRKAHLFAEINFGFYISIEHLVSVFFPKSFFDNRPQFAERRNSIKYDRKGSKLIYFLLIIIYTFIQIPRILK